MLYICILYIYLSIYKYTFVHIICIKLIRSYVPSSGCSVEGQTFQECPPCVRFCTDPIPQCPTVCTPGCACPAGQVIDSVNNRCVDPLQCPGPVNCAVSSNCSLTNFSPFGYSYTLVHLMDCKYLTQYL